MRLAKISRSQTMFNASRARGVNRSGGTMHTSQAKPYRGIGMEGLIARWYAKNTAGDIEDFRRAARMIADRLPPRAQVLEIAPGPGYLAIELARLGPYRITGLDISKSFVGIAAENA